MKKRNLFWVLALFLLGLLLVACGSSSEPDTETEPDTSAEADSGSEADMSETETEADTVAESGLPDLGGREVTIAVENAYLPFNYIDPDTGEAAGWDYDVWDQICGLINCTPVYVEAGWEGMIQAVADGQYDAAADGITITDDRAEIVDFSNGYINIEQRLLVRIDEDRIDSIDSIVNDESLILGTQTGGPGTLRIDGHHAGRQPADLPGFQNPGRFQIRVAGKRVTLAPVWHPAAHYATIDPGPSGQRCPDTGLIIHPLRG